LSQSKDKEAELKKYADTYPEVTLGEEICKLHFQNSSAKKNPEGFGRVTEPHY